MIVAVGESFSLFSSLLLILVLLGFFKYLVIPIFHLYSQSRYMLTVWIAGMFLLYLATISKKYIVKNAIFKRVSVHFIRNRATLIKYFNFSV